MKRVASIGLILIMSLQCFYKLGVMTYFQVNQEYIARVLCINKQEPVKMCHGQCFLKEKLNLGDGNQSDDEPLPPTQRVDLSVFLVSENCYSFGGLVSLELNNTRYHMITSSPHGRTPFHPPAFMS